jgi:histidinol-phosphate aminotransferase
MVGFSVSRYWSDLTKSLTPYVPGEQPRHSKLVKLNTNESPYPPSPKVGRAIAAVDGDALRLYPDPQSTALREAYAQRCGLLPEQVFLGNGSDEVLALTFMALLNQDRRLCFPDITYSFYPVWSSFAGVSHEKIPVMADFSIDPHSFPIENGGIILPNPNAPTGMLMPLEDIETLLQRSSESVVVVDEAYIDFGGESAVSLIDRYDNLLVVQTLSKSRALAGMRVGVAMGHRDLVEGLERVKNSFNSYPLDVVAQHAALASLQDEAYFVDSCQKIIASRESLTLQMQAMDFEVLPSAANFVFTSHPRLSARDLFSGLRERGVVVRYFDKPRIDNYLRISIGTDEECARLLGALESVLRA